MLTKIGDECAKHALDSYGDCYEEERQCRGFIFTDEFP